MMTTMEELLRAVVVVVCICELVIEALWDIYEASAPRLVASFKQQYWLAVSKTSTLIHMLFLFFDLHRSWDVTSWELVIADGRIGC